MFRECLGGVKIIFRLLHDASSQPLPSHFLTVERRMSRFPEFARFGSAITAQARPELALRYCEV